ncbi:DUF4300 family protein [Atopobacter phocae]|uniref:DUF4300 family protein n=1 Tax=Atopobacter phocae TaxID=136492 RepID=UPI00047001EA|nr:DUF4300 family protein [Atopobacter phocae]
MKKILTLIAACVVLTGCHTKENTDSAQPDVQSTKIYYTNLNNKTTQQEAKDILSENKVPDQQIDTLIEWADDFNQRVKNDSLTNGLTPLHDLKVDYSNVSLEMKETDSGDLFPEVNCRLSSFLLSKHLIQTNHQAINDDTFLMFDIEAIDQFDMYHLSPEERANFITLFNWVPMNGTKKEEEQIQLIQQAWSDREIQMAPGNMSLVNVYLHSPLEDIRFVGHTGVLMEQGTQLIFIEKFGPLYPFQTTTFQSREELNDYLLNRDDLYGEKDELPPIIMENDHLLYQK